MTFLRRRGGVGGGCCGRDRHTVMVVFAAAVATPAFDAESSTAVTGTALSFMGTVPAAIAAVVHLLASLLDCYISYFVFSLHFSSFLFSHIMFWLFSSALTLCSFRLC